MILIVKFNNLRLISLETKPPENASQQSRRKKQSTKPLKKHTVAESSQTKRFLAERDLVVFKQASQEISPLTCVTKTQW